MVSAQTGRGTDVAKAEGSVHKADFLKDLTGCINGILEWWASICFKGL